MFTKVGYFVVGNGKFGAMFYGQQFVKVDCDAYYWFDRGYDLVPVMVPAGEYDPMLMEEDDGL